MQAWRRPSDDEQEQLTAAREILSKEPAVDTATRETAVLALVGFLKAGISPRFVLEFTRGHKQPLSLQESIAITDVLVGMKLLKRDEIAQRFFRSWGAQERAKTYIDAFKQAGVSLPIMFCARGDYYHPVRDAMDNKVLKALWRAFDREPKQRRALLYFSASMSRPTLAFFVEQDGVDLATLFERRIKADEKLFDLTPFLVYSTVSDAGKKRMLRHLLRDGVAPAVRLWWEAHVGVLVRPLQDPQQAERIRIVAGYRDRGKLYDPEKWSVEARLLAIQILNLRGRVGTEVHTAQLQIFRRVCGDNLAALSWLCERGLPLNLAFKTTEGQDIKSPDTFAVRLRGVAARLGHNVTKTALELYLDPPVQHIQPSSAASASPNTGSVSTAPAPRPK